jgi:hypothetical protein
MSNEWQYALTDIGLDEQTKQWLRFFSPERLSIDIGIFLSPLEREA